MLTRVVGALEAGGASTIRIVVADPTVAALAGARAVWNPAPERGMLSVCPCDLPRLTGQHVAQVIAAWNGDGSAIVVPAFDGKRGHPTLFGPKVAREILSMNPESQRLNALVRCREAGMVTVEMDDPGPVQDTDTPEEWAALVAEEDCDYAVE